MSYPFTLLGWRITHLSPQGPPQSPKAAKNTTEITTFGLAVFFVGKEGNSHLKTIKCQVFLICPTPSPSWGGASPIRHPRGPPQSPKATKNTTQLTTFGLAVFFVGEEGNSYHKTIKCKVFLIRPTPSPSWGGASPIPHPRGPY